MSAEGGPGPSTMASVPTVPTTAKQLRIKKRVINLVNPADPLEFSTESVSVDQSPYTSKGHEEDPTDTPHTIRLNEEIPPTFVNTPAGDRVRGILRPSGTPGSGNGVRFFPKNKFRIITPNQSVIQAQSPAPKPPRSPTSSSFFSQLLAVTIPSMSPRRAREPTPEEEEVKGSVDDSWEVPGQEGEVSLVASTGSADHTLDSHRDDDEEVEDSWNGEPEVHCSPLSLPSVHEGNNSKDASYQDLELPSTDWHLPEDVSDLLTTKFSPQDPSFSITDGPSAIASPQQDQKTPSPETEFWTGGRTDLSLISDQSARLDDNDPTIRRQLSPVPVKKSVEDSTQAVSPVAPRPFSATSIFADMSAEQAELTWPLTRRPTDGDGESPLPSNKISSATPKSLTNIGDITEFYDCTAMMLSPPDSSLVVRRSPIANDLVLPTKALFEAQAAHTTALSAELQIYRSLAGKLQSEVAERDDVLAKLNMRALEAEVLQTQVHDLRQEISTIKANRQASLSPSPSPMPRVPQRTSLPDLPSDRTMVAQSEAKELEIRLAKALSDAAAMSMQLSEARASKESQAIELESARAAIQAMEEKERDVLVKAEGKDDMAQILRKEVDIAHRQLDDKDDEIHTLRTELDDAHRRDDKLEEAEDRAQTAERELEEVQQQLEEVRRQLENAHSQEDAVHALRAELDSAHAHLDELEGQVDNHELEHLQSELKEANRHISELEHHVNELKEVKAADEEEVERLYSELDKLKSASRKEEDWRGKLREMERRGEMEELERQELGRRWNEEKDLRKSLEVELTQLREDLQTAQEEIFRSQSQRRLPAKEDPALRAEVARLRSESASKDLEILDLQRRKVELKEDREMLNIALDSKQQELELMKRRFAVKGIAGSTPLGTSRRTANLQDSQLATPLPSSSTSVVKGVQTRRRSSLALQTPVPTTRMSNVDTQTPLPGRGARHGVQLHPSTKVVNRVMRRVEEEENRPPAGSLRGRERMLA
ncbi:hypothetical protein IAR55_003278 [Kwoniella newhampshirensis]|uniref:Uncharacterized protein n=1 Tax=Kwoniella newhampshirensis TaxID=1651941 RepID=A0AAW0YM73_9TREE